MQTPQLIVDVFPPVRHTEIQMPAAKKKSPNYYRIMQLIHSRSFVLTVVEGVGVYILAIILLGLLALTLFVLAVMMSPHIIIWLDETWPRN